MQKLDNKEQKRIRDFDKIVLFASYECFCRSTQQKNLFCCYKCKIEAFLQNCGRTILDIEKNLANTKFQTNLI